MAIMSNVFIVSVICKWYQRAVVSAEETKKYFDRITESLHPSYILKWIQQTEEAKALHTDDPLGTASIKPKTRAEVEIDLVTGPATNQTAEIWLLMIGITLEEDQLNLQHYIHSKGRYYKSHADKHLDDDAQAHLIGDASIIPFYPNQDAGQPAEELPTLELFLDEPGTHPEKMKIALPSVFSAQYMARLGIDKLWDQELELQRDQANNALHSIQLAIGQKSFQYTSNMRYVNPNPPVTRPHVAIHALGHQISTLRHVYAKCRKAMVKLNIPHIQEPNHPGSARNKLSWIFTWKRALTPPSLNQILDNARLIPLKKALTGKKERDPEEISHLVPMPHWSFDDHIGEDGLIITCWSEMVALAPLPSASLNSAPNSPPGNLGGALATQPMALDTVPLHEPQDVQMAGQLSPVGTDISSTGLLVVYDAVDEDEDPDRALSDDYEGGASERE
ncbi:hypothetical protein M413DRAFT_32908 [Hebeloma cylindrosporum]|uniref:Uncharacterized protein n=1 Tax=Hebeloma cylindrosporum TaxID=76867 RepID=A0A0C3BDQ5_HEBCY|nr:hypothetical protein M413DRAFT_32908 [Hebeloma cylindrosporum h7]